MFYCYHHLQVRKLRLQELFQTVQLADDSPGTWSQVSLPLEKVLEPPYADLLPCLQIQTPTTSNAVISRQWVGGWAGSVVFPFQ